jgi:2-polyprenyl-3-methyl-5-hydroxy-6-metoxy-1,4-benzoquinol methylase
MKKLLIWGTGKAAAKALRNFPHSRFDVLAFVDNNPKRHGEYQGKPVVSPKLAAQLDYDELVICSSFFSEIKVQAINLGFAKSKIRTTGYLDFLTQPGLLDQEDLDTLSSVPWWYHSFEVLPGVMTPGVCPYKSELLAHSLLQNLNGKKALDIGAWDGPYTLEMSRRGALVTALDIQPPDHSGFDAMRRVNSIDVPHICDSVYNLSKERHGSFDLVTFFGVYYHLRDPLSAFSAINGVLPQGGLMVVEGAVLEGAPLIDSFWKEHADQIREFSKLPLATYVKGEFQGEWSNWWVPTLTCLSHWIESSGFEILEQSLLASDTRGFVVARKVGEVPSEHIVLGSQVNH